MSRTITLTDAEHEIVLTALETMAADLEAATKDAPEAEAEMLRQSAGAYLAIVRKLEG